MGDGRKSTDIPPGLWVNRVESEDVSVRLGFSSTMMPWDGFVDRARVDVDVALRTLKQGLENVGIVVDRGIREKTGYFRPWNW